MNVLRATRDRSLNMILNLALLDCVALKIYNKKVFQLNLKMNVKF